tara:strand:- start:1176 stop:1442 length:267 start_codon:yes stop_codon:yes gene_type:complete
MEDFLPTIESQMYLIAELDKCSEPMYDEEMLAGYHLKDKLNAERKDLLQDGTREFNVEFETFYTSMIHLLEKRVESYAVYGLDTISLV